MRPAESIEKKIKKLRYDANTETHKKVLGNVLQVLDKQEKRKSGTTPPDIRRMIMKNPITKIAAAAVFIVAVLIGICFFPDTMGSTAYAQVANRLRIARTLTYTAITNSQIEIDIAFKEPGSMRVSMPGGYITVIDWIQGKVLSTLPTRMEYIEMTIDGLAGDPAHQQFETVEKLRALPEQADEYLGTINENGRILQGYRVVQNDTINTVWIDGETQDLVRVETEYINASGMNIVITDFQFDSYLDDSLFSLTPPTGYTSMNIQVNTSEITEQDLITYLRLWTTWTKDQSFPPTLHPMEIQKVSMEMEQQDMFNEGETPTQERMQHAMEMARGIMFVMQLLGESNWRYAGENVQYGDAATPIFWYKPAGTNTYRVIYGDLSVQDVVPEDLPD